MSGKALFYTGFWSRVDQIPYFLEYHDSSFLRIHFLIRLKIFAIPIQLSIIGIANKIINRIMTKAMTVHLLSFT